MYNKKDMKESYDNGFKEGVKELAGCILVIVLGCGLLGLMWAVIG